MAKINDKRLFDKKWEIKKLFHFPVRSEFTVFFVNMFTSVGLNDEEKRIMI
jgi:hypothetical protein